MTRIITNTIEKNQIDLASSPSQNGAGESVILEHIVRHFSPKFTYKLEITLIWLSHSMIGYNVGYFLNKVSSFFNQE
jgi:hypothetical protein